MSSYLTASPFLAAIQKARGTSGRLWGRGASQITPRVYLSDLWTACDEKEMERLEITHVISVIEHRPALPDQIPIHRRLQVFLADRSDANILIYFEETNKFIMDALAENETNKVLVHCQQGISRSATIVCAYVIATMQLDALEAIEYVQAKRSIVCPNSGFRLQLATFSTPYIKKPKPKSVGKDIAGRIRSLFPEKAAVKRVTTEEVTVVAGGSS
ncbi:hypothetical protein MD484_g5766, partial [Candolleomyces efflorescens]